MRPIQAELLDGGAECRTCKLRSVCPDPILPASAESPQERSRGPRLGRARRLERPAPRRRKSG